MGRVRINQPPDIGIDWTTNEPVTITAWDKQKKSHADPHARYVANILKSGRFRIPDVPAGDYKLDIPVNNPPSANACGAGAEIGRATLEFTVPEIPGGRSNAPVDLGDIEATLLDTLDPGEIAPDFVAGLIGREEGATIRLRNHHGKLVLLDFWASWCAPCIAEMPALKELQTRFAKDPRFVMISLSCDSDAQSALQTIEKHSLPWTQAFLGDAVHRPYTSCHLSDRSGWKGPGEEPARQRLGKGHCRSPEE
jgi:thiol-disulfide isomerase/thioredoxin